MGPSILYDLSHSFDFFFFNFDVRRRLRCQIRQFEVMWCCLKYYVFRWPKRMIDKWSVVKDENYIGTWIGRDRTFGCFGSIKNCFFFKKCPPKKWTRVSMCSTFRIDYCYNCCDLDCRSSPSRKSIKFFRVRENEDSRFGCMFIYRQNNINIFIDAKLSIVYVTRIRKKNWQYFVTSFSWSSKKISKKGLIFRYLLILKKISIYNIQFIRQRNEKVAKDHKDMYRNSVRSKRLNEDQMIDQLIE